MLIFFHSETKGGFPELFLIHALNLKTNMPICLIDFYYRLARSVFNPLVLSSHF